MRCPELRQAHWRDAYRTSLRYFPRHPSELLLPPLPQQAEGDVEGRGKDTSGRSFPTRLTSCSSCRQQEGHSYEVDCGDVGICGSIFDLSCSSSSSTLGSTGSSSSDWDQGVSGSSILDIERRVMMVISSSSGKDGSHGVDSEHQDDEEQSRGRGPSSAAPGNGRGKGSHGEGRCHGRGPVSGVGLDGRGSAAGWGWPHLLSSVAAFLN